MAQSSSAAVNSSVFLVMSIATHALPVMAMGGHITLVSHNATLKPFVVVVGVSRGERANVVCCSNSPVPTALTCVPGPKGSAH